MNERANDQAVDGNGILSTLLLLCRVTSVSVSDSKGAPGVAHLLGVHVELDSTRVESSSIKSQLIILNNNMININQ